MSSEVFNLAILLSLKDAASGGLDRAGTKIRALGKDGKLLSEAFDDLRDNLNRDLAIGGVGVAGLMLLKKGVDEAGDLETTVLNLRQAYQEVASQSGKTREQQESDIRKILALATELGNQLQGNTSTYADIFTAMNKAGIDAEITLSGAGKAAAYLANVTGAIRKGTAPQLAEDLGSYGKMFDLKGNEYMKVVELFSSLEDRFNIGSSNLVEASKYFFSTAKGVMGMRGLSGAEDTGKLFAFVKRYAGREGSEAGTTLDAVITQFIAHKKKVQDLFSDKGIKLEFFDAKGNFQGIENMFTQFEKLRTLSPEERGIRLNEIFGEQGARVAGAMVEQGVQGWRNITAEANKSVSVNEKIKGQMDTYNAKTEALSGSWQNFKATAFTPLMDSTKGFLDKANSIVGSMQKFSAENPGLMKTLGTLAAYGTTALVVYSGFKTLTTGIRMFRLASAFSSGAGLIPYLNGTATAANVASTSMATATTRATGLRGAIQGISSNSTVRVGVQIASIIGIEYLLQLIAWEVQQAINAGEANKRVSTGAKENYELFQKSQSQGMTYNQKDLEGKANLAWSIALNSGLDFAIGGKQWEKMSFWQKFSHGAAQSYLYPITKWSGAENKFAGYGREHDKNTIAQGFKTYNPELQDSRIMAEFLKQLPQRITNPDERKTVQEGVQTAFPESFSKAMQELSGLNFTPFTQSFAEFSQNSQQMGQQTQTTVQSLSELQQPFYTTQQTVTNFGESASKVPTPLNNIATSANSASNSLNSLSSKIENWQMPSPNIQTIQVPIQSTDGANSSTIIPSRAIGGVVERDGMAMVHAGNIITPARVTKGLNVAKVDLGNSSSSAPISISYSPQITIKGGDKKATKEFRALLYQHKKDLEQIVTERMNNGRVRA